MRSVVISAFVALATSLLLTTGIAQAQWKSTYNYISAEDVAQAIRAKSGAYAIVDIQLKEGYESRHLQGSIPTYAYPVKNDAQKQSLKEALSHIGDGQKIVVVCPGGKSGAKATVDYYKTLGVDGSRLLILENGANGFPMGKIADVVDVKP